MEEEEKFFKTLESTKGPWKGEFRISIPYTGIEFSYCAERTPKNFWIKFSLENGDFSGYLKEIWSKIRIINFSGKDGEKRFVFYFSFKGYIFALTFWGNYYIESGTFLIKKNNSLS